MSRKSKESKEIMNRMEVEKMAETLLYEWWYAISEEIFERVCQVTELDEEQKEALRSVALRPNDFQMEIEEKEES